MAILALICADPTSAQTNNYVIDPTFDTGDYYTKGTMYGFKYRESYNDLYINFGRSSGISEAEDQSIVDLNGNLLYNVFDLFGGTPYLYRDGILSQSSGLGYRVLPPHPDAGSVLDDEIFFFEYSKSVYSFPGNLTIHRDILILPDTSFLVAGRFTTDSINPGILGYRHLVRIDSIGDPVEDFPDIICQPWSGVALGIKATDEGNYWLAGEFSGINTHQTNYLARLNADFTVDTTYVSPFVESDGWVSIINVDSGGNLWMGCGAGCNISTAELEDRTLLKLTPEGLIDEEFNIPDAYTFFDSESDEVFRLVPGLAFEDTDGSFIMGGSIMEYNGVPVKRIFKITPTGDLIPEAFENFGADEAEWDGWTHGSGLPFIRVNQITRMPDDKLLIGGAFSSFGGEPYSCLVRLEQDGFVSTINQAKDDLGIVVWPNPTADHIRWNKDITAITMYNSHGQKILDMELESGTKDLSLPLLPEGIYTLVFSLEDQKVTIKLIIQKR
ncbi:T9SS type A sorting domain-containing protein [Cryomorpha ignava]|uniref:T9SS type A sorting domain-containing protein n=1 Tax=Cryomorpha ignava TaxID=101383 RepID=A0A7K3WMY1_9FLAO|nr:T9SS type A sorting domain-containing protein [Cryomorpha ignava]NEN22844.1 T9SS type A sorting domain-containing protein [Cryomorpha ignava]